MQCDLCGSGGQLYKADIEGTRLNVCRKCAGFGRIIAPIVPVKEEKQKKEIKSADANEPETIRMITAGFPEKIKQAREKLGLKQDEFAKMIKEKESVVHKMETGEFSPSLSLAEKLERILRIKLVDEYESRFRKAASKKAEELTIGDMIKIKKK